MTADRGHWSRVYAENPSEALSWYEPAPSASLAMIEEIGLPTDAPIVDVGGGSSRLAAELLKRGHSDITVLDISREALERARQGVPEADRITWVVGDVQSHNFGRRFALWRDRAVFHFMVAPEHQHAYLATLRRSLAPGGHLIFATFGPDGPSHCSGLPVARYTPDTLAATLGDMAEPISSRYEIHRTPSGKSQQFLFSHLVARSQSA